MAKNALHEILSTHVWCMHPDALHAYRDLVMSHIADRQPVAKAEKESPVEALSALSPRSQGEKRVVPMTYRQIRYDGIPDDAEAVLVTRLEGPVLRNSDACAYGSIEQKSQILWANTQPQIVGHIFLVNGPGGSSNAIHDYKDALDDARRAGKPSVAFIQGMAASADYAAAMMCDEVYAYSDHEEVGCIGAMIAGFLNCPGDVNATTQERYVEVYAEGSPWKNREFRAAEQGDLSGFQALVNKACNEFHALAREHRPNITEDQLKGDTYMSGDVVGTLVDGILDFGGCVDRVRQLASGQPQKQDDPEPEEPRREDDTDKPHARRTPAESTIQDMGKQYNSIREALSLEALESDADNGIYLNEEMADGMTAYVDRAKEQAEELAQKDAECEQKLQEAEANHSAQLKEALEQQEAAHAEAIEAVKAELASAQEALAQQEESGKQLEAALAEAKQTAEHLQAQLDALTAERDQLKGEVEELSREAGEAPAPEGAAESNGEASTLSGGAICHSQMTLAEKQAAYLKRKKELGL